MEFWHRRWDWWSLFGQSAMICRPMCTACLLIFSLRIKSPMDVVESECVEDEKQVLLRWSALGAWSSYNDLLLRTG